MDNPQPSQILPAVDVEGQTAALPAIAIGSRAVAALEEWFFGEVANDNTRAAYRRAIARFTAWAKERGYSLPQLRAPQLRDYLKEMEAAGLSAPTIKQHLAAIRAVFNALMRAGEIDVNPAQSVKGPRLSVREGKTPAFTTDDARRFLATMDGNELKDKRDRALVSLMLYSFARVSAALGMDLKDYAQQSDGFFLHLDEKGGKRRKLPAHSALVAAMADYLDAGGLRPLSGPLFRTIDRKTGALSARRMGRSDAYRMIRERAAAAGLAPDPNVRHGNHTWRATGITAFLESDGDLKLAQEIAGHAELRTTGLYDRRGDRIKQNEIERIRI